FGIADFVPGIPRHMISAVLDHLIKLCHLAPYDKPSGKKLQKICQGNASDLSKKHKIDLRLSFRSTRLCSTRTVLGSDADSLRFFGLIFSCLNSNLETW